jgi:hypothetical protein
MDSSSASPLPTHTLGSYSIDPQEAYQRGEADFNFFAYLAMPDVMLCPFPEHYVAMFSLVTSRNPEDVGKILRFALGLPRGFAKTTFIKVLVCWLIVYKRVHFVLIVCATDDLAQNLLADVSDILGSDNMEAVYGTWANLLVTDTKREKRGRYLGRNFNMVCRGALTGVRGINLQNKRPDFILLDDMQTKENDDSLTERVRLLKWFVSTLLKCISPTGDRIVAYLGNMYSTDCILYKLKENPSWVSMITGAILADGTSLWEDVHSLEDILESFFHDESMGAAEEWHAEVMNDPLAAARNLLTKDLPQTPDSVLGMNPDGAFLTIDPAGFRTTSDDNVIVAHCIKEGKGCIAEVVGGAEISDPEQLVLTSLRLAQEHRATVIGVEMVGFQQSLDFWFRKYMKDLCIEGITIVELKPHNRTKESRIRQFIQDLLRGDYFFLRPQDRALFMWWAMKYKIGKKDNRDDYLDAPSYGLDVRNDYWPLIGLLNEGPKGPKTHRVRSNNTPF